MSAWKGLDPGTSEKSAKNPSASIPTSCSGFLTATLLSVPATNSGVFAVIVVALTTVIEVGGTPPIRTSAPGWKFAPRIVTFVPAVFGPESGAMAETTGAPGTGVGVRVGVRVGVAVGGTGVAVGVRVGVAVGGTGVAVGVIVGVGVGPVGVGVGVAVGVGVGGMGVAVGVAVGVGGAPARVSSYTVVSPGSRVSENLMSVPVRVTARLVLLSSSVAVTVVEVEMPSPAPSRVRVTAVMEVPEFWAVT